MNRLTVLIALALLVTIGNAQDPQSTTKTAGADTTSNWRAQERHLKHIRMLTNGGENAEAYFSSKGDMLIYQTSHPPYQCDQIFLMNSDGSSKHIVSSGKGRTTCSFIAPDYQRIIYASTHAADTLCPPKPDLSKGYVWALFDYDIYSAKPDGTDLKNLTHSPGYDAEAVYSPDGSKIVFTSKRSGDLEIYTMNPDGSDLKQLTHELGYDGGPFFSYDGKQIIYRASRPKTAKDSADYVALLKENLVRPSELEIFIMNADGTHQRQITHLGKASFAPYLHPDGKRLAFCTNYGGSIREFDIYLINVDGTGLERVSYNPTFDGFPMWSQDGKKFVFCSNRDNEQPGETNVFIADWVD
jgi:TolB protein